MGAYVHAVDVLEDAAGFHDADHADTLDSLVSFDECLSVARQAEIDGILTDQCDYSLRTASYVAERLELPQVDIDTAFLTTHKGRTRRRLEGVVPQPDFRICETFDKVIEFFRDVGYPGVVKPVDSRGAFGVSRVDAEVDLRDAYLDAIANSLAGTVIAEKFIQGIPLTVEGYHVEGRYLTLTIGSKTDPLGNLSPDREIVYPAQIPDGSWQTVEETNEVAARALDIDHGATHAEYILTEDGEPHLIEFHNRGGGIHISAKVVPWMTGFDVSKQLVADALSLDLRQPGDSARSTGVVLLSQLKFDPGVVVGIEGLDAVRSFEDVLTVQPYFECGDEIESYDRPTESHGLVIATGDDLDEAKQVRDDVLTRLSLEYRSE